MMAIFAARNCRRLYQSERGVGDNFKISGSRVRRRASSFEFRRAKAGTGSEQQCDVHMQLDR
jgi:hypothetical protein